MIIASAGGLYFLLKSLQNHGHENLATGIMFGLLIGLICSVPTLILASKKRKPLTTYLWINLVAGAVAGLCLAIPAGIGTFIHALGVSTGGKS